MLEPIAIRLVCQLEVACVSDDGLTALVVEEVNEQVDVADLLGDGTLDDQLDAGVIGAAVGREFGASVGRELGETIGREVQETVTEGIDREKQPREVAADVKTATADALLSGLADLDGRESLVSLLRSVGDEGGVGDRLADAAQVESPEDERADDASDEDEDEPETAEETPEEESDEAPEEEEADEDGETETESGSEADTEPTDDESDDGVADADEAGNGTGDLQVDDLEELRQETLEDFLELMSYRDLQSVAKDVGVKANLSREEMTDRIVDEVSAGEAT